MGARSKPATPALNRIIVGECVDALAELPAEWADVIFADPPYDASFEGAVVERYVSALAPGGVLTLEQAATAPPPEPTGSLEIWKSRRYGGTLLTLYRNSAEECA